MEVAFVPPTLHGPRRAKVKEATHLDGDQWLLTFTGVKGRDAAEEIVGSFCLARNDELREAADDAEWLEVDCIGYTVVDTELGQLGELLDIMEMPAQSLMVVTRPNGEEVLIPIVDEFLIGIDDDAETVTVETPSGLVD